MKFTSTLIKGKLIKRYKRFFVDIKVNNSILTAHCPNTGSMMGLLNEGNDVWVTKNNDPKRKLKFTLEMIKVNKKLIDSKEKGYEPFVLFLTQIQGIKNFRIAKDIDKDYYQNYLTAKKAGVKFMAYRCSLNSKEIKIEKKIKIIDE